MVQCTATRYPATTPSQWSGGWWSASPSPSSTWRTAPGTATTGWRSLMAPANRTRNWANIGEALCLVTMEPSSHQGTVGVSLTCAAYFQSSGTQWPCSGGAQVPSDVEHEHAGVRGNYYRRYTWRDPVSGLPRQIPAPAQCWLYLDHLRGSGQDDPVSLCHAQHWNCNYDRLGEFYFLFLLLSFNMNYCQDFQFECIGKYIIMNGLLCFRNYRG